MDEKNSKQVDIQSWANLSRSVLNGVVGDYLVKENNPLAIEMAFYHQDKALVLDETLAQQLHGQSDKTLSNKIIVLVHGLTNLETVWDLKPDVSDVEKEAGESDSANDAPVETSNENSNDASNDNYGRRIQKAYGFSPFYLRYNTGLSIQENGQQLCELVSQLVSAYPIEIDEIVLMGFSMGGLLIRSAQKVAQDTELSWIEKLSNCYYIGTPHEGSPLEKFGHLTSSIVRLIPREYISHWADWIDMRSEGIQDLKHGLLHLKNPDAGSDVEVEADQDDPYEQSARCGSFYTHAQHHFISGALSRNKDSLVNKFFGDSLVRHSSANPISAPEDSKQAHFAGIPHIPLAHSEKVYQQIKQWFEEHEEIELKYAEPAAGVESSSSQPDRLSNQEIISGTIDLLATAYDHTVETVEKVHHSITKEPYTLLKKIPVVKEVSEPVSSAHKDILDTIYFSLKEGGKLAHKGAKLIAPRKRQNSQRKKTEDE